jgi:hypothetical protein
MRTLFPVTSGAPAVRDKARSESSRRREADLFICRIVEILLIFTMIKILTSLTIARDYLNPVKNYIKLPDLGLKLCHLRKTGG